MTEKNKDKFSQMNWQDVYARTPEAVQEGVEKAFRRIHLRQRRRRYVLRGMAVAAVLVFAAGAALVTWGREPKRQDRMAAPSVAPEALGADSTVYAAMEDHCFHCMRDCPQARGELVAVQLVTALEFDKRPCGVCAAGVELPPEE